MEELIKKVEQKSLLEPSVVGDGQNLMGLF